MDLTNFCRVFSTASWKGRGNKKIEMDIIKEEIDVRIIEEKGEERKIMREVAGEWGRKVRIIQRWKRKVEEQGRE